MCCPLDPSNVSVQRCAGVLLIMGVSSFPRLTFSHLMDQRDHPAVRDRSAPRDPLSVPEHSPRLDGLHAVLQRR